MRRTLLESMTHGPLTEEAITKFQGSHVLPTTGLYDDITASALVQAVLAAPADVPVKDLDMEAESDDVTRLQTVLQQLGYMELVTGYYGEITAEAVTNFQQDNGIYGTGAYETITRMALAARLRPPVASEPIAEELEMVRAGFVAFGILPY